jgi:hypothetical protein
MAKQSYTAFWLGYVPSTPNVGPSNPKAGPELGAVPDYIDTVILAFSNLFPGNTTSNGFLQKSNTGDQIKEGIATIRKNAPNTKILLSLIGTPNPRVGWNTGISDPDAFGQWCAHVADDMDLDGFDIDNEDLDSFPGDQFVAAVKGMRKAMPHKILTMDTYLFDRDKVVIGQLADTLDSISTMAYFLDFDQMTRLVEQYAAIIAPSKISIGVKAAKVGIDQGTSLEDTKKLCTWEPTGGAKKGMMLWNLSQDLTAITGEPDFAYTKAIHECLP